MRHLKRVTDLKTFPGILEDGLIGWKSSDNGGGWKIFNEEINTYGSKNTLSKNYLAVSKLFSFKFWMVISDKNI